MLAAAGSWVAYSRSARPRRRQIIEMNLGEIVPGKVAAGKVLIPNPTRTPLTVKRILKDCSCVAVDLNRGRIAAGEEAELSFQYNAPNHGGPIAHVLEITYHELPLRTVVRVAGTVVGWVKVDKDMVDFGEVCIGRESGETLRVETPDSWPEEARVAEFLLDGGKVDSVELEARRSRGSSLNFHLRFAPAIDFTPGEVQGEFVLKWKGMPERTIRVPCIATAVNPCLSDPTTAFFGVVGAAETKQIDLHVRSRTADESIDLRDCRLELDLPPVFDVVCSYAEQVAMDVSVGIKGDSPRPTGLQRGRISVVGPAKNVLVSMPVWAMFTE